MLEIKVDDECVRQNVHGSAVDIAIDVARAISAIYRSMRRRNALGAAVFRGAVTAIIDNDSPVWAVSHKPEDASVDILPGALDVIKRVVEEGGQQHDGD